MIEIWFKMSWYINFQQFHSAESHFNEESRRETKNNETFAEFIKRWKWRTAKWSAKEGKNSSKAKQSRRKTNIIIKFASNVLQEPKINIFSPSQATNQCVHTNINFVESIFFEWGAAIKAYTTTTTSRRHKLLVNEMKCCYNGVTLIECSLLADWTSRSVVGGLCSLALSVGVCLCNFMIFIYSFEHVLHKKQQWDIQICL